MREEDRMKQQEKIFLSALVILATCGTPAYAEKPQSIIQVSEGMEIVLPKGWHWEEVDPFSVEVVHEESPNDTSLGGIAFTISLSDSKGYAKDAPSAIQLDIASGRASDKGTRRALVNKPQHTRLEDGRELWWFESYSPAAEDTEAGTAFQFYGYVAWPEASRYGKFSSYRPYTDRRFLNADKRSVGSVGGKAIFFSSKQFRDNMRKAFFELAPGVRPIAPSHTVIHPSQDLVADIPDGWWPRIVRKDQCLEFRKRSPEEEEKEIDWSKLTREELNQELDKSRLRNEQQEATEVVIHTYASTNAQLKEGTAVLQDITGYFAKEGVAIGPIQKIAAAEGEAIWTKNSGGDRPYLGVVPVGSGWYFVNVQDPLGGQEGIKEAFLAILRSLRTSDKR